MRDAGKSCYPLLASVWVRSVPVIMTSNAPSNSQPPSDNNSEIPPAFLQQAMAKRAQYQEAAAADRLKIEEARSGIGINNMQRAIAEHQQFVAEEQQSNQPPVLVVPERTQLNPNEPDSS